MKRLRVVSESSGDKVGEIVLTDDDQVQADKAVGEGIVLQLMAARGVTEQQAFALLAEGWSNGYITIPALSSA